MGRAGAVAGERTALGDVAFAATVRVNAPRFGAGGAASAGGGGSPGRIASAGRVGSAGRAAPAAVDAHGWSSAARTPYTLTAGRAPRHAGEVVLDARVGRPRAGRRPRWSARPARDGIARGSVTRVHGAARVEPV
jgi:hypothetical protein